MLIAWYAVRPAAAEQLPQATYYVALAGSDENPGTDQKPFRTLDRARKAVRKINATMTGNIMVVLRGGTYAIDRTILFDATDSGTNGYDVIYRAAMKERPVISGSKPVVGWRPDRKGRWKAPAPVGEFRQLYVNGVRMTRARGLPPAGIAIEGENGYKTAEVNMVDWKNLADLEFCYQVVWAHSRCKVAGIFHDGDRAIITMLQPYFSHARTKAGVRVDIPTYIENALELLDEPGEWYLDRPARMVYYLPKSGEDMAKVEVITPALEKLVELRGTLDRPVHNIRFEGIGFQYGGWLRPNKIGHADVQANFILDPERTDSYVRAEGGLVNPHNEYLKSPANVICHAAKSIRFDRCTFMQLGGAGLDIECGSQNNTVVGCRFYDISGTAVQIGDVLKDDHHPDDPRKIVKNNTVENCYIHNCSMEYMDGMGVFAGYTEGTRIAHNEICHLPYSGISVGWGWGMEDVGGGGYKQPHRYDTPTPAKDNCIEMNHIHDVMQSLQDGAGIYTLGNQPGTIIRRNHIHDNRGVPGGIYLDEGSGMIEVVGNLVYGTPKPMFYNNRAQNRIATCKEHGNHFQPVPDKSKKMSTAARGIIEAAGLEPAYHDLLEKEQ